MKIRLHTNIIKCVSLALANMFQLNCVYKLKSFFFHRLFLVISSFTFSFFKAQHVFLIKNETINNYSTKHLKLLKLNIHLLYVSGFSCVKKVEHTGRAGDEKRIRGRRSTV